VAKGPPTDRSRSDGANDSDQPKRRTPTYVEAVRTHTPSGTKPGAGRTQIGLPTMSIVPGMGKRRSPEPESAPERAEAAKPSPVVVTRAEPAAPAEPASAAMIVASAPAGAGTLERLARPEPRRLRPSVPAAEIRPTRHRVPADRKWPLVLLDQRLLPQAAAMRSLRHRIADRGDPRTILVTSAGTRDGKTFCAANLALALAEVRRARVLLLDANIHHPSVASVFGLKDYRCVLEQVESHKRNFLTPWEVIETSTHDLHVLAISRKPDEPRQIEAGIFANCLDSLAGTYDYVIIDGPPINAGPEVALLEDAVDGMIIVARSDTAHVKSLRYALDQVSQKDVLGVVLLDV